MTERMTGPVILLLLDRPVEVSLIIRRFSTNADEAGIDEYKYYLYYCIAWTVMCITVLPVVMFVKKYIDRVSTSNIFPNVGYLTSE